MKTASFTVQDRKYTMIINLAQITFPTHTVHISRDDTDGTIVCFKYDCSACDFESFQDETEAADWMLMAIPTYSYTVITHD